MKRLLPIVLLACLMAPLVATFTVHEYRKEQVRREVKWRLIRAGDRGDLTLVRGTLQELAGRLRWVHDREFELNGQMFDVVEKVVSGDSCYYYCWHDHAETSLNRQMKQLLARALASDPVNRDRDSKVRDFFKSLYFEAKDDHRPAWPSERTTLLPRSGAQLYCSPTPETPAPPPKSC